MASHAALTPRGPVLVDGVEYRLREAEGNDEFVVLRERDGERVGSFELVGSRHGAPRVRVSRDSTEPELVRTIARLLAMPRGLLPLQ